MIEGKGKDRTWRLRSPPQRRILFIPYYWSNLVGGAELKLFVIFERGVEGGVGESFQKDIRYVFQGMLQRETIGGDAVTQGGHHTSGTICHAATQNVLSALWTSAEFSSKDFKCCSSAVLF